MFDLEMLVVTEDGRERSADQLRQLLTGAGLVTQNVRVRATGTAVASATI
jgi:hypothetical protein